MAEAWVGSQQRPGFFRWAALGLMALLAACQTVPKGRAPGAGPAAGDGKAPITSALPDDAERHRIALLVPMTGPNAVVGQSIANAANLAILDTGGKRLRMTTYDTGSGAAAAAQRAIADGNRLFLGPLLATDVRLIAPVAAKANVPIITFSNDDDVAGDGVYVLGFSPAQSIRRVVSYAHARGMTRFAGLIPRGAYGSNASTALIKAAEATGGQVVAMQDYAREPKSLAAAIAKLGKGQNFDAVLIADGGRIAAAAAPQIRKGPSPNAKILGTELWNAEGIAGGTSALHGAWYASVADGLFNQLSTKYRARYGKAPSRLASIGYDAVLLAVRIAGDWDAGARFPISKLEDKGGFAGIDGAFRFGASHIAERSLEVQEVGGGTVSPAPKGFDN